ncbi:DoxX family protein [Roseibacterium beibuensis]|nr:DoxX family protein [Roseibacterium beibuensis]MCS6624122.1 DoxX family protein [Roseibacterium beibuensis]
MLNLTGRVLIAVLFLGGTFQKILDPSQVQGMLTGIALPAWLVWPVALFNLVAALALVFGPWVRAWALVLAAYCLVTSFFHWQLRADPWQVTIMVKNWSIAGGLLILAATGPGRYVKWHVRLWPRRKKPDH